MKSIYAILGFLFFSLLSLPAQDRVWPGDANNNGVVNEVDILYWGKAFGSSGTPRMPPDSTFIGYNLPSPLWNQNFWNGLNYAYADANGDGFVDNLDLTQSYIANFNRIQGSVRSSDAFPPSAPGLVPEIRISSQTTEVNGNETIEFLIDLGDDVVGVENFHGIAFRLFYDTAFISTGLNLEWVADDWIRDENPDNTELFFKDNPQDGFTQVAITKKDQHPISGQGTILRGIVVVEDIFFKPTKDSLVIAIDSVRLVTPTLQAITTLNNNLAIKRTVTNTDEPKIFQGGVNIFPNPANGAFNIQTRDPNNEIEHIQVINMLGQTLQNVTLGQQRTSYTMNTDPIGSGVFLIRTKTKYKIYTRKVFIQ